MTELSRARFETRDVSVSGVLLVAAGLALTVAAVCVASWLTYQSLSGSYADRDSSTFPLSRNDRLPPPPRLEGIERLEGLAKSADERSLRTYSWVDRKNRIVRIPIDRAMKLVVDRYGDSSRAKTAKEDGQ